MRSRRPGALITAALVAATAAAALAQPAASPELAQRLAAVKQAAAANKAALQQYTWTETIQVALNGEVKTTKQMGCRYGPDGKPQCVPTGQQPAPQQERGIRGRMAEKKKEEFTDYMQQVKGLIGLYVPPDAGRMEASRAAGNLSLSRAGAGEAALVFRNYAQPGDAMTLDFSMTAHKLAALNVNTYLGDASSPVTLAVRFAPLPDGTNYPMQETVNAPAKGITLTVSNSNYMKLAN